MKHTRAEKNILKKGKLQLLEIKDSDIRLLTLKQCEEAVDKGIHSGGAFSSVIPMVALYYGGTMNIDVKNPTKIGQDLFVLSKGHAVASMASIYADLGYFDRSVLVNSRSAESILNGHPGPILPNAHISTGPLGQGIAVAEGLAIQGKNSPKFDVYCLMGDGELQEGIVWEAFMYSAHKNLDNLCVMIDKNVGQLDIVDRLIFPMQDLANKMKSFGWNVIDLDATQYDPIIDALDNFKFNTKNGKPTAIICNTTKGFGGYSNFLNKHKVVVDDDLMAQEVDKQKDLRERRITEFSAYLSSIKNNNDLIDSLNSFAQNINIDINIEKGNVTKVIPIVVPVKTKKAEKRDKTINYNSKALPNLDKTKEYAPAFINTLVMKEFAKDSKVVSIDSDLASTSGLEAGVGWVDQNRALNVGVAEANMMNIGEAYAVTGHNAWVSTFCPFFDWKVMRRIAVGHQERIEDIESKNGWLNEGHGLDLTFVATAPNFETKTNGATHMGNDDILFFDNMSQLKIIDVSCPQLQIAIMKWIAEGNKGLVYMRIMRTASGVIYNSDVKFEFGKGYVLRSNKDDKAILISSGRGVHEALNVYEMLQKDNIHIQVIDMPSIDEELIVDCYKSGKPIILAEQNNGYIYSKTIKALIRNGVQINPEKIIAINALDKNGRPKFIHSGTYSQLLKKYSLNPETLSSKIKETI